MTRQWCKTCGGPAWTRELRARLVAALRRAAKRGERVEVQSITNENQCRVCWVAGLPWWWECQATAAGRDDEREKYRGREHEANAWEHDQASWVYGHMVSECDDEQRARHEEETRCRARWTSGHGVAGNIGHTSRDVPAYAPCDRYDPETGEPKRGCLRAPVILEREYVVRELRTGESRVVRDRVVITPDP